MFYGWNIIHTGAAKIISGFQKYDLATVLPAGKCKIKGKLHVPMVKLVRRVRWSTFQNDITNISYRKLDVDDPKVEIGKKIAKFETLFVKI